MKLVKAIEILTLMGTPDFQGHTEDILAARQLGIEALDRILQLRHTKDAYSWEPLPGETPDIDPKRSLHSIKKIMESPIGEK